jgi:hypothetical protein
VADPIYPVHTDTHNGFFVSIQNADLRNPHEAGVWGVKSSGSLTSHSIAAATFKLREAEIDGSTVVDFNSFNGGGNPRNDNNVQLTAIFDDGRKL